MMQLKHGFGNRNLQIQDPSRCNNSVDINVSTAQFRLPKITPFDTFVLIDRPLNASFDLSNSRYFIERHSDEHDDIEYPYILIKGKYMGYGGRITEIGDEVDNEINDINGYEILEVIDDDDKNKFIINLRQDEMNIKFNKDNKEFSNIQNKLSDQIPNPSKYLGNNTKFLDVTNQIRKTYDIGFDGCVYQKQIDKS